MKNTVKIAACQLPDIHEDIEKSLGIIIDYASKAEAQSATLVCFPECYLQGYVVHSEKTAQLALDLSSPEFAIVLQRLRHLRPTLVLGVIEKSEGRLYNTAVVIRQGKVLGYYRKTHLLAGEKIFEAGNDYPIFEVNGLRFGINICYDLNFSACAKAVSDQNAHVLLCPSNNMMPRKIAETWKDKHNEIRAQRALESKLWLISSDVTGEKDGHVSYGPTAAIRPDGKVITQVPLLQEGMILQKISF
jgi:5-aminopentanamidase